MLWRNCSKYQMDSKDTDIITALARLGLIEDPVLTPEQEEQLQLALDPELQRLKDIEDLFTEE